MEMSETAGPAPTPAERPNAWSRIAGVIFSPVETLRSVSEQPDWIAAFAVLIVISVGANAIIAPHIDVAATVRQQMESRKNVSEAQIQAAISFGTKMAKFSIVIAFVAVPVVLLVMAGVLHFAFRAFGGEGTFAQAWAVTVYSSIPGMLLVIIMTVLAAFRGSMTQQDLTLMVKSNPGAFLDPMEMPVLYAFAKAIDVFAIWRVALLTVGFSFVSRLSRGRSAGIVVSLWAVIVIFQVAFAAFGKLMSGS
jgi:Yip1 domain